MRIVLFNLNNYVGGGEVLITHFASYLKKNNVDYVIITTINSYILEESLKKKFNHLLWPTKSLGYLFANSSEKINIECFFKKNFSIDDCFLTCNMRELYSFIELRKRLNTINKIQFKNIILHPEEYKYGASYSFKKSSIENFNKSLLKQLDDLEINIYPNENARLKSIGPYTKGYGLNYIPFPSFDILKPLNTRKENNINTVNILTVSRFVPFKISSILELIKVVKKNKNYHLTIIGYGTFKFLIKLYILGYGKRIRLLDKVNPEKLLKYIRESDIGVGQGTTILQMISNGLPTIISPYSRWYDFLLGKETFSFGVFTTENLEFGDQISDEFLKKVKFKNSIETLLGNYDFYLDQTYEVAKHLRSEKIFGQLVETILNSNIDIENHRFDTNKPSRLKRLVRSFL